MNEYLKRKYPEIEINGQILKNEYCIIDSRVHGMFACFYCILYGLYICEQENLKPIIVLGKNHLYYDPLIGENIFDYFFLQHDKEIGTEHCQLAKMRILNPSVFLKWCRVSTAEGIISNYLIKKYFILKKEIASTIADFQRRNFHGFRVLGVHYRGKDKVKETPILAFKIYERKIDRLFKLKVCDKIFFATDELHLRDFVKRKYGERVILYNMEADYSQVTAAQKSGLHFTLKAPFLHAKDALIECYLLSRCSLFMGSSNSSMSLFPTFINPDLIYIVLNP